MFWYSPLSISASALTANRLRLDVIAENIANADTTRSTYDGTRWQPYQRRVVSLAPIPLEPTARTGFLGKPGTFRATLKEAMSQAAAAPGGGVRVTAIDIDRSPGKRVYDPAHPDADADGFVTLPNVDVTREMIDLLSVSRAYEANVTAFGAGKAIWQKTLEIGRG
ncbi:MAG: flagellar basal body rod protein FlgC [Hydrogenibacillus sp.]|nr:flagellar basal body rod protein FlgC [Hydrogenibacillus sp.]